MDNEIYYMLPNNKQVELLSEIHIANYDFNDFDELIEELRKVTSLYINKEVTLTKMYNSTADFEINLPVNETIYPLEGLLDLAEDIPA